MSFYFQCGGFLRSANVSIHCWGNCRFVAYRSVKCIIKAQNPTILHHGKFLNNSKIMTYHQNNDVAVMKPTPLTLHSTIFKLIARII